MLKEEKKNITLENNDEKQYQSESQEIEEALQQPQLKDNSFSQPRIKRRKRQNIQGGKTLFDIFYELITLVNKHHRLVDKNTGIEEVNENNYQNLVSNRLLNKKKNNKIAKSQIQDLKGSKDIQKSKQNSNKKQPTPTLKETYEVPKKHVSFNQVSSNKNYSSSFQDQLKKKQIFDNYSVIMNYRFNSNEDEGEINHNLHLARPFKFKNPEQSLSQYSFAHSSRNAEERQKRKFSVQKTIDIKVPKTPAMLQIVPQFQLTQNQCETTCFNLKKPGQN